MTEALRVRAELHLLARVLSEQYEAADEARTASWQRQGVAERAADFAEHVAALRAIGALTEAEAAWWMKRFDAEVGLPVGPPVPAGQGMPEPGRRLLDELLDCSARGRRGSGVGRRDRSPYEHALFALRDCGAISRQEYRCWLERLVEHPALSESAAAALRQAARPPIRCSGIDLGRVLIAPATPLGSDLQIRHVEIYADGLRLFWQRPSGRETAEREAPLPAVDGAAEHVRQAHNKKRTRPLPQVRDDAGTRYHGYGASHDHMLHQTDSLEFEMATYSPGIPAAARQLQISHGAATVQLSVAP